MPFDQYQKLDTTDAGLLRRVAAATERSLFAAFGPDLNRIADKMDKDEQRLFLMPDQPHEDADFLRVIASEYDKAAQPKTRDKLYELAFKIDAESDRVRDAFEAGWITNAGHISQDYLMGCMATDYEAYTNAGPGYFLERVGEALERGEEAEKQTGTSSFTKIGFDPDRDILDSLRDHMTGSTVVVAWPHRIFHAAHDTIESLRHEHESLKKQVHDATHVAVKASPQTFATGGIVQRHVGGLMGEMGPEPIKPVYGKVHGDINADNVKFDGIPWDHVVATKINTEDCVVRGDDVRLKGEPLIKHVHIGSKKEDDAGNAEDELYQRIADTTAADMAEHIAKNVDVGRLSVRGVDCAGEEPAGLQTLVDEATDNVPELDRLYDLRDNIVEEIAALNEDHVYFSRNFRSLKGKLTGVDLAIEAVVEAQNPDED